MRPTQRRLIDGRHRRMHGGVPGGGAQGDHVGVERVDEPRRAHTREHETADGDGLRPERRDQPALPLAASCERGADAVGNPLRSVEVGLGRVVLDLDVDEHAGAGVEGCIEGRDIGRQVARRGGANHAPVGQPRVVMDDQLAVTGAAHVELDPVRPELGGTPERRQRVLGFGRGRAAVSDDRGHPTMLSDRFQRWAI